jgi:hypothetical protein
MSDKVLAQKAHQRMLEKGIPIMDIPVLASFIPEALKQKSLAIAYSVDRSELQKEIVVSCVNGSITLSDATLLVDLIPTTGTLLINGALSKPKMRYEDLTVQLPKDNYYHALQGRKIIVKEIATGTLGSAGGGGGIAGTLYANYLATLAQMPDRYDPDLVDLLIKVAREGMTGEVKKGEVNVNLNSD